MQHDVVIIGGGINGAGLFRDLALHGIDVLLLEKGDFSSQTSQGSSKMLHGGIRYLENFDFGLVQEALEEKNLWLKLAPHLCVERQFHLPVYRGSKWPLPFVRLGLFLYDLLSHFQNRPHGHADLAQVLEKFPQLKSHGLTGAGTYFDGIVDDHKLALECIWDAEIEPNARSLNYQEVLSVSQGPLSTITYRDLLTGKINEVTAKFVIFATGPFTDELMKKWGIPWEPALLPSKGIHLWLKPQALKLHGPMVLPANDGRVVFVIPQRDHILVGTTETPVNEEMFNIKATDADVSYLLQVLRDYFPTANVGHDQIINTFAAIRPLVREANSSDRGKTSRFHRVFRPGLNMYALLGGKYTTFRRMAQDICRELTPRLGVPYSSTKTLAPLRRPSVVGTFENADVTEERILKILRTEKVRTYEDLVHRRLSLLTPSEELEVLAGRPKSAWETQISQARVK